MSIRGEHFEGIPELFHCFVQQFYINARCVISKQIYAGLDKFRRKVMIFLSSEAAEEVQDQLMFPARVARVIRLYGSSRHVPSLNRA